MELFKFSNSPATDLLNGFAITGYTSAMWVERYRTPGEFEIVAPLSSGLRSELPLGTIISHVDTLELAIVENHHIEEAQDSDPIITITGRSFESYLENRIVGTNEAWDDPPAPFFEYGLIANKSWDQAVILINDHVSGPVDSNETLNGHIIAATSLSGTGVTPLRYLKRGSLHERLVELLAVDDLGIRMIRRNPWGVLGNDTTTYFQIHRGVDRSNKIIFSWQAGELESAEYLWSLKNLKNVALVQGRFVEEIVYTGANNYDRRVMFVDASDIDGALTTAPTGSTLTEIRAKMYTRGEEALANQNEINIATTDIARVTQYRFRTDYDIGDIVSVDGNYGDIEKRRVVEYVEVEDEGGESGHPTLAVL